MLMQYSSINSRNLRNQALNFSANHIDDGTHEFPHIHIWDWTKKLPRQDSRR